MSEEKDMPLLGHIGELRRHLFRILIVIVIVALVIGFKIEWVTDNVLLAPASNDFISIDWVNRMFQKMGLHDTQFKYNENFIIQQKDLPETFNLSIKIAIFGAFIVAFPYVLWEIWRFIAPGLKSNEKKNSGVYLLCTILLFFLGAMFGYFIISPIAIQFFINYDISSRIEKIISISSIISTIITSTLGMALVFLLPVVSFALTSIGILEPSFLRKYRKQAFILILVIAAIITPSDIMSMFVAAVPLWILYEVSILVSAGVYKRKIKEASS